MNNEIEMIKKLKKNEKVFSRLSKKDRELFKKVGTENCVRWSSHDGDWKLVLNDFVSDFVYRIHEDYQPDPDMIHIQRLCDIWLNEV